MGTPSANITFALVNGTVCIRVDGRANFSCSGDFKRLVLDMIESGNKRFIVDLKDCVIMDSTFLGMLAGLGMNHSDDKAPPAEKTIELLNPSERVADLIDNLGVSDFFNIVSGELPEEVDCNQQMEHREGSKQEVAGDCLAAHQVLMDLNPENRAKFKDVVKYFADEAGKSE